ncbi:MAG: tryptophan synthase subunit alpha [Melioribacteraceae bacterium]|nr:tryptophan synthase subunit alpha [Melioribacteraceae bacterium]
MKISEYIDSVNKTRKVLSIFLTAGYPNKDKFVDTALSVLDAGADMIEIGIPFSDPLADGPVIQKSSYSALMNGVTMKDVFSYTEAILKKTNKPIVLMGYANPIMKYEKNNFAQDSINCGAKGLIVPDVPINEYDDFYNETYNDLEIVLLTTPTSDEERIKAIDKKSRGFVYCVSITGTTGVMNNFDESVYKNIERTYKTLNNNKMLIGFGISKPEDVTRFSDYCDGVIIGSAVIKSLSKDDEKHTATLKLIKDISQSCNI